MSNGKRILLVRPDRIGDVVLSTPIPRELKKKYPDCFVAVLIRKYTEDIFLNNPHVDEIIAVENDYLSSPGGSIELIKLLRKLSFTHSLSLIPTEKLNYILFFAGIKNRIGVGYKFYQFITNSKSVFRNKYKPLRHEADYCMDTARKIGVDSPDLAPEIHLSVSEKISVSKIRKELLGNKKFLVGVHASSGSSAPNWKSEDYKRLIERLLKMEDLAVTVTDNAVPEELSALAEVNYPNQNKELRESILNIAAHDIIISASTGPMHIAAALRVTTLSLFCPLIACSPKLWGPLGNDSSIIMPDDFYCSYQCPGDPKICDFSGEGGIDTGKVISELKSMLKFIN